MRTSLILPLLAMLAGCSGATANAPSLLPRPIESRSDAVAVHPIPAPEPDPALDAKIAVLSNQVDKAVADFDEAAPQVKQSVEAASGAETGSERWIAAQAALSRLDGLRTGILSPLVDLEDLAIARAQSGKPPYPALETAISNAEAADAKQAERLQAIEALAPGYSSPG
ncbi:hypothetical protein [Stakelama marina]|uniref:Uncharacterized protein n=1 Tax=Stakelama marina TaxID=2826939 RepID=A0A8T4IBL9_9SPHN|nr:hypothetical protein [Stakelama marina]MBR0551833.1 hypothetical protein [Stakelama marina]